MRIKFACLVPMILAIDCYAAAVKSKPLAVDAITFSKNSDSEKVRLEIKKHLRVHQYDCTLYTSSYVELVDKSFEKKETLVYAASCVEEEEDILCTRDLMHSGGPKTLVKIKKDPVNGSYELSRFYSPQNSRHPEKNKDAKWTFIVNGLERDL